ncbi:LANO_0G17920g1_1 [Lachancea nothofagi CBS 11611]|uniref:LANO_0G17920g1_1 n=1 Tax=Lachancea nothofagi CBS 11611 TaxID=1266666 RepID=A0A1G4KKK1_9SACH|nr:LANO_0G17920g1_1 [Lachancea nothofagi CBS 11611]
MSKGPKSRPKHRKKTKDAIKQREQPKSRVLTRKSTNENDNGNRRVAQEPTTPRATYEEFLLRTDAIENWPTTYLENGDFFVETIRSAASETDLGGGSPSDNDQNSCSVSDEFRHYDVLDELLCEQVDPAFSLVPTPNSRAASVLVAKTANNSFDWEISDESNDSLSWSELVLDAQARIQTVHAKFYTGFWTGVVNIGLQASAWTEKLYELIIKAGEEQSLETNKNYKRTKKQRLRLLVSRTFKYSQAHPYSALFIFSFSATFAPVLIVFITIMSIFSLLMSLFYLGIFLSVSAVASVLILPLMGMSMFFASGVVVCGFFSNIFFRLAQFVYGSSTVYTNKSLRSVADQIPPSVGFAESTGGGRNTTLVSKFSNYYKRQDLGPPEPILISGADIPVKSLGIPMTM